MPNVSDQFPAFEAAEREAEKVTRAHCADRDRGECLQRRPDRQERSQKALSHEQDGGTDQERSNRRK